MSYLHEMTDDELEEWQKKQVDRCLVENTINKLIEYYGVLEQNTDLRLYDVRSQNLEESAILMAISEHGLHQNQPLHGGLRDERQQQENQFYGHCGTSGLGNMRTVEASCLPPSAEYSDDSCSSSESSPDILETAVAVALQKQGLGLSGINRL